jgi:uncharacterized protein
MQRILLLSDTHHFLDPNIATHAKDCHEIWHAGDFGTIKLAEDLQQQTGLKLRGVYGNIDGQDIRSVYPENNLFTIEGVKVMITHIGGYPPTYNPRVRPLLDQHQPKLFIDGHSHILKVMFDEKRQCLHMNPGAAGKQGWHKVRTMLRFVIDGENMRDCEVIELGKRS